MSKIGPKIDFLVKILGQLPTDWLLEDLLETQPQPIGFLRGLDSQVSPCGHSAILNFERISPSHALVKLPVHLWPIVRVKVQKKGQNLLKIKEFQGARQGGTS